MKLLFVMAVVAFTAAGVAQSQDKPAGDGDYGGFVSDVLHCMADAQGDPDVQMDCIVNGVRICQERADAYEPCLGALRDGFDAAIARVEAARLKDCDAKRDMTCPVLERGSILMRMESGLDAEQWADALTGGS